MQPVEPIREAWIDKRSRYLKTWRRRWLVLNSESLATYAQRHGTKQTFFVKIEEISEVAPVEAHTSSRYIFRVQSLTLTILMAVGNDSERCDWLSSINAARKNSILPQAVVSERVAVESRIRTLIKDFVQGLASREQELLQELEQTYSCNRAFVQQISEDSTSDINTCASQLKELQNRSKYQVGRLPENTKEFQGFPRATLHVDTSKVSLMLQQNVNVCLTNPKEHRLRRTAITRALKWNYIANRIDALSFTVSQPILLTGIGLCRPWRSTGSTTVLRLIVCAGNKTSGRRLYTHQTPEVMLYNENQSVYRVTLRPPVRIGQGIHTLACSIQGSSTYKCVDCFSGVQDAVFWQFSDSRFQHLSMSNKCCVQCGPIADFYYVPA